MIVSVCFQTRSDAQAPVRGQLNESQFEIDRNRGLILYHAAAADQLETKQPTSSRKQPAITYDTHRRLVCEIDLPILHIVTGQKKIADEPKVPAVLKILEPGSAALRFPIAIEWRGKTSQTYPKKSFGFELRDREQFQSTTKQSLLGMR